MQQKQSNQDDKRTSIKAQPENDSGQQSKQNQQQQQQNEINSNRRDDNSEDEKIPEFICTTHKQPAKYLCSQYDCLFDNRVACGECIAEKPHGFHQKIQLDKLVDKMVLTKSRLKTIQYDLQTHKEITDKIKQTFKNIREKVIDEFSKFFTRLENKWLDKFDDFNTAYSPDQGKLWTIKKRLSPSNLFKIKDLDSLQFLLDINEKQDPLNFVKQIVQLPFPQQSKTYINDKLEVFFQQAKDTLLTSVRCQMEEFEFLDKTKQTHNQTQQLSTLNLQQMSPDSNADSGTGSSGCEYSMNNILQVSSSQIGFKIPIFDQQKFQGKMKQDFTISDENEILSILPLDKSVNYFATGNAMGKVKVWSLREKKCIKLFHRHNGPVQVLTLLDANFFASGSWDKTIRIWNWKDSKSTRALVGHTASVTCIRKLNSIKILSSSADLSIKVWNWKLGSQLHNINDAHTSDINTVLIVDGHTILSASKDKTFKIWQFNNSGSTCIKTQQAHQCLTSALMLADNKFIALGTGNGDVQIWNFSTWKLERVLGGQKKGSVWKIFLLNSEAICSCGHNDSMKIWNWMTGECLMTLTGHQGFVWDAIIADPDLIISVGGDNRIIVWE